jgi:hypothetical protein
MTADRWRAWASRAVLSLGAVGGVGFSIFAYANDPFKEQLFPPCVVFASTGLLCPGCGGTRAVHSLLHGDLIGSLDSNPLVLGALLSVGAIAVGASRLSSRAPRASSWVMNLALVPLFLTLIYSGAIRNIWP